MNGKQYPSKEFLDFLDVVAAKYKAQKEEEFLQLMNEIESFNRQNLIDKCLDNRDFKSLNAILNLH